LLSIDQHFLSVGSGFVQMSDGVSLNFIYYNSLLTFRWVNMKEACSSAFTFKTSLSVLA